MYKELEIEIEIENTNFLPKSKVNPFAFLQK